MRRVRQIDRHHTDALRLLLGPTALKQVCSRRRERFQQPQLVGMPIICRLIHVLSRLHITLKSCLHYTLVCARRVNGPLVRRERFFRLDILSSTSVSLSTVAEEAARRVASRRSCCTHTHVYVILVTVVGRIKLTTLATATAFRGEIWDKFSDRKYPSFSDIPEFPPKAM